MPSHSFDSSKPPNRGTAIGANQSGASAAGMSRNGMPRPKGLESPASGGGGSRWSRLTQRTRLLIVMGVMGVVLIGTGLVLVRSQRRAEAERDFQQATKQAQSALAAGRLSDAAEQFGAASIAADVIGQDSGRSRYVHQLAKECDVLLSLSSKGPLDLLRDATAPGVTSDNWRETFHALYRDSWLVWDARVTRRPAVDKRQLPQVEIDCPLITDSARLRVEVGPQTFRHIVADGEPRRVLFAARLVEMRPIGTDPETQLAMWTLRLRDDSIIEWCDSSTWGLLGMPSDQVHERILSDQSKQAGVDRPAKTDVSVGSGDVPESNATAPRGVGK